MPGHPSGKAPPLTPKQEDILDDVYYNKKNFFGRDKIWRLIRDQGISRRQVAAWLEHQEVNQLYRAPRKTKTIAPTVLKSPYNQIGIDLIDMSTHAVDDYHWILSAIDLFTKKAWALPLKTKTATSVRDGMKTILKQMKHKPKSLRSDNGSEFISKEFKQLLTQKGIKQVLSLAGKPQSNGQIERFNGILKRLIAMDRAQNDNDDWASQLPTFVDNYNNSYQRVIKDTPNNVETHHKGTKELIQKSAEKLKHLEPKPAKVGDIVRVKLLVKGGFKFSREKYQIKSVLQPRKEYQPIRYRLKFPNGEPVTEIYYRNDLLVIPKTTKTQIEEPQKYIISRLVKPKLVRRIQYYQVRWKNYPPSADTDEPRAQLMEDIPKEVEQFEKKHKVVWQKNNVSYE